MEMTELAEKVDIKHPIDVHNITINADPFRPNAYVISLPLDSDPSYVWHTLFEQTLSSSLDFWDRKVLVVGKELKLVTTRNGLEEKLKWLEGVVNTTNRQVEEHNKKAKWEKQVKEPRRADEEAIRQELANWEMRGRLAPR
jgi:hypothetical protein